MLETLRGGQGVPSAVAGEDEGGDARQDAEEAPQPRGQLMIPPECTFETLDSLAVFSLLGIFSFLGTLARLGLMAIGTYNGQSIFPLLWAQLVGCCLMGMFTVRKKSIEEIYIPLYVGLTSGLCGSITSFSTWMGDVFQAFAQIDTIPHPGFYNFMDGLGISVVTLATSSGAFVLGRHVGPVILHPRGMRAVARWVRFNRHSRCDPAIRGGNNAREASTHADQSRTQAIEDPNGLNVKLENGKEARQPSDTVKTPVTATEGMSTYYPAMVHLQLCLLFLLMWLATILITVYVARWRGMVSFALVMSPIGVWLRFQLSRLNPHFKRFPIGTFLANMLGTAVLAVLLALQYTPGRNLLDCQVMQGIADGFCGALTTVSTFIVELERLERKHAYAYAIGSWVGGQLLMLVILGSVQFARPGGLVHAKCDVSGVY